MIISRNYWDTVPENIDSPRIMLFLIISSRARVHAPLDFAHSEYVDITGKGMNDYRRSYKKIVKTVKDNPPGVSYLNVPEWFFKIGLKNKYELLIAHYYITKLHNSKRGSPKISYKEFIEKYSIPAHRRLKKKYETIIKKLIAKNYEKRPNNKKEV